MKKSDKPVTKELKIEPLYPIKAPRISNVLVLGCGGTGSYVIPGLVRMIASMKTPVCLTLADADEVETKNLIRQNFIKSDVGKNKAEILAKRYSSAFGLGIQYVPDFIETKAKLSSVLREASLNGLNYGTSSPPLVISCVDNIKARKVVVDALLETFDVSFLVDCGNEESNGQVLTSCLTKSNMLESGIYRTPHMFEIFPELNERLGTAKHASELSCAEMAEGATEQFGFVNLTAATIALNAIFDLMNGNPVSTYMTEFSIKNTYAQRVLNKTNVSSWKTYGLNY